jgi:serine/threonine protein kinase/tetratricopeptide (TPR) repeat protein
MANREEKNGDIPEGKKPFFSASPMDSTASLNSAKEPLGGQIGPYKLLSVLGEGGFGIVYLAEQHDPIRRRVALKVIKPGMDTKQVIARFEAERQALALFDHPNIAHVYDAGTTKTGHPYFAMELVKGMPITEHCDQEKLSIKERLSLFLDVCDAIQYAHQKGVIHRDIKPSNILVSVEGKGAVPRVIDFGVAKAISQPLTDRTLYTEQGQFIGTPEYMSPEQAEMTTQDIDTRSDVYSLGVVLYELLTGVLPFDPKTLREAGIDRLRQIIREEEPKTPSTRLSRLGEEAVRIAAKRRTEVRTLANRLHKELEWIPMKAMRKECGRRYRSVSELADDVQNYLNGNPLIAGPESITYKLKKYVRKRVRFVAAAAIVIMAVLAGLVVSTTMYFRAENARSGELNQRNIAEAERDRAMKAEQQANERLVDVYEQEGRLHMNSGRYAEALVYLNEAYQIDDTHISLQFLIADGIRKYNASVFQEKSVFSPWRVNDRIIHVSAFSISPNRKCVALMEKDKNDVYFFETENGQLIGQFRLGNIENLVFTQNAEYLVVKSRSDETQRYNVEIIEVASQKTKVSNNFPDLSLQMDRFFELYHRYVSERAAIEASYQSIYTSPHGRWIALVGIDPNSLETQINWWEVKSGQLQQVTVDLGAPFIKAGFSFDGNRITAAGFRSFYLIYDTKTASVIKKGYDNHWIHSDAIGPKDHIYLLSEFNGKGYGMLMHGNKLVNTFTNSAGGGFSPDGRRLVIKHATGIMTGRRTNIPEYTCATLWNSESGKCLAEFIGSEMKNWHFTPDSSRVVTEHTDGRIKIWNTENGNLVLTLHPEEGHVVRDICPDSLWLMTHNSDNQKTVTLWSLRTGDGFEFKAESRSIVNLSSKWLNTEKDFILRFSNVSPKGLPRFNASGLKLITSEGLHVATYQTIEAGEVEKWVKSHLPYRLEAGQIRRASDEEMLEAKLGYFTVTKGAQDPNTLTTKMDILSVQVNQLIDEGRLSDATNLITEMRSWLPLKMPHLVERGKSISKKLSSEYLKCADIKERCCSYEDAIAAYEAALSIDHDNPLVFTKLSWLQATCPDSNFYDPRSAIKNGNKACELTSWQDWQSLATLAAAYAANENFKAAVNFQKKAIELLPENKKNRWQANFQARMRLYSINRPHSRKDFWSVPTEHLIGWWKFDDNKGRITSDFSGHRRNGYLMGDACWETTYRGGTVRLDGENDYVKCGNDSAFNITDAITITAWIKLNKFAARRHDPIISKGDSSWRLQRWGITDKVCFVIECIDNKVSTGIRKAYRAMARTRIDDNQWHHIVGTYNSEHIDIYIDGILYDSVNAPGAINCNDYEVCIGGNLERWDMDPEWNGSIDDVRIYNRFFHRDEIIEMFYFEDAYENGKPVVEAGEMQEITWPDNTARLDGTAIDDQDIPRFSTLSVKWSQINGPGQVEFLPSGYVEDPCVVLPKPGLYNLLFTANDGENEVSDSVTISVYSSEFDGLLAHYTFDNDTAHNVSTVDGLHGQFRGEARTIEDTQRGKVLDLDQGGDYVDCGADPRFNISREITLSVWLKVTGVGKSNQQIVTKGIRSWGLRWRGEARQIYFYCAGAWVVDVSGDFHAVGGGPIVDGKWYHVVGVCSEEGLFLYIDGTLKTYLPLLTNHYINQSDEKMLIGDRYEHGESQGNWKIDDIRIYNRALSPDDISELYTYTK